MPDQSAIPKNSGPENIEFRIRFKEIAEFVAQISLEAEEHNLEILGYSIDQFDQKTDTAEIRLKLVRFGDIFPPDSGSPTVHP